MIIVDLVSALSNFYGSKISRKHIFKFQNFLLNSGINIYSCDVLAVLTFVSVILTLISFILVFLLKINPIILLFSFFSPFVFLFTYISYMAEKRRKLIDEASADFLKQLSSMLKVGLSFENSMEYMVNYGSGPLYDEIRRTIYEIKLGSNFDDAWINLGIRLNSINLQRCFMIILDSRKSGGSVAQVLDDLSEDLRAINILRKERKSSVMMAVMFLLISAVFAAPFAMGMVSIYSSFIGSLGKNNSLLSIAPVLSGIYIIIHSFLVGFIVSLILYGNLKRGFYYGLPLMIVAYLIFYIVSNIGLSLFSVSI